MSSTSDLLPILQFLQLNSYSALITITAVVYDYLLTFSSEVEYVWLKPWTWISTLFLLVRYLGISAAILYALDGTSLLPGPVLSCTIVHVFVGWLLPIFLAAADLVMIVRVYAMWNRSKRILAALLVLYVAQLVLSFVYAGLYSNPSTYLSVSVGQILNFSFCVPMLSNIPGAQLYDAYPASLRLALGAILLLLAVAQTLKQTVMMYQATKVWQPNQYLQLLVRHGVLYFVTNTFFNAVSIIQIVTVPLLFIISLSSAFLFTLIPRFIISVRELYASSVRGHATDTGFGAVSRFASSRTAVVSSIAFADVTPGRTVVEGEADGWETSRTRVEV